MTLEEFLLMILAWVIGSVLSAIILGVMADKYVLKKIFKNQDVQNLLQLLKDARDYLKKIQENQKQKHK